MRTADYWRLKTQIVTSEETPVELHPEEISLLRECFSGIASMSAGDKALRNAMVHLQMSPEVLGFSLSDKRIAMERVRTR